jgi:hypothetical protein
MWMRVKVTMAAAPDASTASNSVAPHDTHCRTPSSTMPQARQRWRRMRPSPSPAKNAALGASG